MTHPHLDLDLLERVAREATAGKWHRMGDAIRTVVGEPIVYGHATHISEMEQCKANLAHIASNSPDVTLALVARVRELEAGLGEALDRWDTERDTEGYYQHERSIALRSLLAKRKP